MQDEEIDDDGGSLFPMVTAGVFTQQEQDLLNKGDLVAYRELQKEREAEPAQSILPGEPLTPSRSFVEAMQRPGWDFETGLESARAGFDGFCKNVNATEQQRADLVVLFDDVAELARAGDEAAAGLVEKTLLVFSHRTPRDVRHFKRELKRRLTLSESGLFDEMISG